MDVKHEICHPLHSIVVEGVRLFWNPARERWAPEPARVPNAVVVMMPNGSDMVLEPGAELVLDDDGAVHIIDLVDQGTRVRLSSMGRDKLSRTKLMSQPVRGRGGSAPSGLRNLTFES